MNKKLISSSVLYFILVMFVLPFYPGKVSAEEPLSISGLAVETKSFRPYREKGKFSFFLNRTAQVTAEIQDSDFNLVRTLALLEPGISGKNNLEWDGKDEKGKLIEDGKYILTMSAMTDDGSSALISKEVSFDLDASEGAEFKTIIFKIEGKDKKPHIHEAPEKMKINWDFFQCLVGICLFPISIPVVYVPDILNKNTGEGAGRIYYRKDYEELAKINREIDEYNAEIDAEIAEENKVTSSMRKLRKP